MGAPVFLQLNNFAIAERKQYFIPFHIFQPGFDLSWIYSPPTGFTPQSLSSLCNGTTTTFTLSGSPGTLLWVYWNGVFQEPGVGFNWTTGSNTFTMVQTPGTGDSLYAIWM